MRGADFGTVSECFLLPLKCALKEDAFERWSKGRFFFELWFKERKRCKESLCLQYVTVWFLRKWKINPVVIYELLWCLSFFPQLQMFSAFLSLFREGPGLYDISGGLHCNIIEFRPFPLWGRIWLSWKSSLTAVTSVQIWLQLLPRQQPARTCLRGYLS